MISVGFWWIRLISPDHALVEAIMRPSLILPITPRSRCVVASSSCASAATVLQRLPITSSREATPPYCCSSTSPLGVVEPPGISPSPPGPSMASPQVKQVKSRMMGDLAYTSTLDCFVKTLKNDGPLAFYKGFLPNFARLGSWNVIMFLTLEQVQKLFVRKPGS